MIAHHINVVIKTALLAFKWMLHWFLSNHYAIRLYGLRGVLSPAIAVLLMALALLLYFSFYCIFSITSVGLVGIVGIMLFIQVLSAIILFYAELNVAITHFKNRE